MIVTTGKSILKHKATGFVFIATGVEADKEDYEIVAELSEALSTWHVDKDRVKMKNFTDEASMKTFDKNGKHQKNK